MYISPVGLTLDMRGIFSTSNLMTRSSLACEASIEMVVCS